MEGGTRASLVGLVGEEAFLERFLLLIIIIKSILRSAQQKKEGQMTFLFKFLAGLRGLEPRLTGPEAQQREKVSVKECPGSQAENAFFRQKAASWAVRRGKWAEKRTIAPSGEGGKAAAGATAFWVF